MTAPSTSLSPEQLQSLLNGPAGTPPAGVIPNFNDPANLDTYGFFTVSVCMTLATVAVLLRIYTKTFIIRSLANEDYVIVLAWLLQIGDTGPAIMISRYGGGTHIWDVRLHEYFRMLYWVNITAILYGPVIFFIKLSILLQYLRIFAPTRKGNMFIFVGAHICIWSSLVLYFVETIFEINLCTPREKIWNPLLDGHCFNVYATFQSPAIFNVITDFAILVLPMPSVWKLQMSFRNKIAMTAIFGTGLLACISSILRAYYTWKVSTLPDKTYDIMQMCLWNYAELATGVFISCLPVIPKFFQHVGPRISAMVSNKTRLQGGYRQELSPRAASTKHGSVLPSWTKNPGSGRSDTLLDVRGGYSQRSEENYTCDGFDIACSNNNASHELGELPLARPAKTQNNITGGYQEL